MSASPPLATTSGDITPMNNVSEEEKPQIPLPPVRHVYTTGTPLTVPEINDSGICMNRSSTPSVDGLHVKTGLPEADDEQIEVIQPSFPIEMNG